MVAFWWVASLLWVSVSDARLEHVLRAVRTSAVWINQQVPAWVAAHLPWNTAQSVAVLTAQRVIPLTFGHQAVSGGAVSAQTALAVAVSTWTGFALLIWSLVLIAGALAGAAVSAWRVRRHGVHGRLRNDAWQGVSCSVGPLFRPHWMRQPTRFNLKFHDPSLQSWWTTYERAQPAHAKALRAILGVIAASDAHAGEGHAKLAQHTASVLAQAVRGQDAARSDPLIALLAASHDLGKVITHATTVKADNRWGYHDTLGMRILAGLSEIQTLSFDDRDILLLLTGYAHKAGERPEPHNPDPAVKERMLRVRESMHHADATATAQEQAARRAEPEYADAMERAFFSALKANLALGAKQRVVHAHDRRQGQGLLYLRVSETKFAKLLAAALGDDVAAAGGSRRDAKSGGLAGVTLELMRWLDVRGWLVKELYGVKSRFNLFDVVAGTLEMNGVWFVDVKPDLEDKLKKARLSNVLASPKVFVLNYVQDHHLPQGSNSAVDLEAARLNPPLEQAPGCEPGAETVRDKEAAKRAPRARRATRETSAPPAVSPTPQADAALLDETTPSQSTPAAMGDGSELQDGSQVKKPLAVEGGDSFATSGSAPEAVADPENREVAEPSFENLIEGSQSGKGLRLAIEERLQSAGTARDARWLTRKAAAIVDERSRRRTLAQDNGKPADVPRNDGKPGGRKGKRPSKGGSVASLISSG